MKKTNKKIVTLAIFITTFMTAIEGTIVTTAMPTIVADLQGIKLMNWVVAVFLLATALSTPVFGKLADGIGRKLIFLIGIALFTIGSALCGFSTSMLQLICSRIVQGIGSGAMQTVAITILADLFEPKTRAKLLGINSSFWGLASVIAPLLGGLIVQNLSWHWVFMINVPLGILNILLIQYYFVEEKHKHTLKMDIKGTLSLLTALLAIMLLMEMIQQPIFWLWKLLLFIIAIVFAVIFERVERHAEDPLISIELLHNKPFLLVNALTFFTFGLVMAYEFYLPTWLQGINGTSATLAGFAVTPSSIFWIIGSFTCGTLVAKIGQKRLFAILLAVLAVVFLLMLSFTIKTPSYIFWLLGPFAGFSFGILSMQTLLACQEMVAKSHVGVATSFNTLMKYLGQTILVSTYGLIFNFSLNKEILTNHKISLQMLTDIVSQKTAHLVPAELVEQVRQILLLSIKNVYVMTIILIALALICNQKIKLMKK
ncbi:MAG: MDR family MFS transporter [Lactobacillus sp.]|nr:MDR family MFS transporter [Lactobacillus sp.]